MSRQSANKEILAVLAKLVHEHPDWRFGQLMRNCGVVNEKQGALPQGPLIWVDEFYLESEFLLKRIKSMAKACNEL